MNKSNRFLLSFVGLIIAQVIMSLEEIVGRYPEYIKIFTEKLHNKVSFFPVVEINAQVFMFGSLVLIIILFIFLGLLFIGSKWSRLIAIIIGVTELINGTFHIFASFYFDKYIAGSITAFAVVIFSILIIIFKPSFVEEETKESQ